MIAILDYGSGNLRSAQRAFATTGHDVQLTSDLEVALKADGLVVPGVGAFAACMKGINEISAAEVIRQRKIEGKATLGICIGMQILFSDGLEHGTHKGIGVWQGAITQLVAPILPHMGWNTMEITGPTRLFKGVEKESFYFVHSYAAKESVGISQAWSTHGEKFLAAVEDGALSATQFHPEKSGRAGLTLIANWSATL
ncbi:MAG: imidazole glycerol phosphate synthase subunit HisH [Candidatus Planktophila sp.]